MDRVTNVESQRIIHVLDETVQKITFISAISKELTSLSNPAQIEELNELLGSEFGERMRELKIAEDSISSKGEKISADELQNKILDFSRFLYANPEILEKLKQFMGGGISRSVSQAMKNLLKHFSELREFMVQRLSTTVEEEKSKQDMVLDIQSKQQRAISELTSLQKQLQDIRNKHEKEENYRKSTIAKLKDEISQIKANFTSEKKLLEAETQAKETKDSQSHLEKSSLQLTTIQTLESSLSETVKSNKSKDQLLRKKKSKTEQEVDKWINKYDHDMQEKDSELKSIKKDYEQILQELAELTQRYDSVVEERGILLTEEQNIQDELMKQAEQWKHIQHSAIVIQRWWKEQLKKLILLKKQKKKKKPQK